MTTQSVQVKLELGHSACLRDRPTNEGFTHDWTVFVRGPEGSNILHFVEKVVFHLHESFPKPKRVIKDPPYQVSESGYGSFLLPIEIYFKNKEDPRKIKFDYDLFLHLEGTPPVNHIRCEKLTFQNPTEEFRRKLLKGGGVGILPGTGDSNSTQLSATTTTPASQPPPSSHNKVFENLFGAPIKADPAKKPKSKDKSSKQSASTEPSTKPPKIHREGDSSSRGGFDDDRARRPQKDEDTVPKRAPRLDDLSGKVPKAEDRGNKSIRDEDHVGRTPKHDERSHKTPRDDDRAFKSLKSEESGRKTPRDEDRGHRKEAGSSKRSTPESRSGERGHSSKKHKRDRSRESSHSSSKNHSASHSKHSKDGEKKRSDGSSKDHHKETSKHREKQSSSQRKSTSQKTAVKEPLPSHSDRKPVTESPAKPVATSTYVHRGHHIASKPCAMEKAKAATPPPPALLPPPPSACSNTPHSQVNARLVPFEDELSTGELSDVDPFDDPPELENETDRDEAVHRPAVEHAVTAEAANKMTLSESDSSSDDEDSEMVVSERELFASSQSAPSLPLSGRISPSLPQHSEKRLQESAYSNNKDSDVCVNQSVKRSPTQLQPSGENSHPLKTKAAQKAPAWQYSLERNSPIQAGLCGKENQTLFDSNSECLPCAQPEGIVELQLKAPNGETFLSLLQLQERLMGLHDSLMLARVMKIIQETGHYEVSEAFFNFDLCSIDSNTVKKIKAFLATTGSSAVTAPPANLKT